MNKVSKVSKQPVSSAPAVVRGPKESAYDELVAPLVTQIVALARQHSLDLLLYVHLDDDMFVRTTLPVSGDLGFHTLAREFQYLTKVSPVK
jgi:hypothetical protein